MAMDTFVTKVAGVSMVTMAALLPRLLMVLGCEVHKNIPDTSYLISSESHRT